MFFVDIYIKVCLCVSGVLVVYEGSNLNVMLMYIKCGWLYFVWIYRYK